VNEPVPSFGGSLAGGAPQSAVASSLPPSGLSSLGLKPSVEIPLLVLESVNPRRFAPLVSLARRTHRISWVFKPVELSSPSLKSLRIPRVSFGSTYASPNRLHRRAPALLGSFRVLALVYPSDKAIDLRRRGLYGFSR
jgi:hypothetical protein